MAYEGKGAGKSEKQEKGEQNQCAGSRAVGELRLSCVGLVSVIHIVDIFDCFEALSEG